MVRLLAIVLLFVSTGVFAQRGPIPTGQPVGTELEVHKTHAKFVEAWNRHDVEAMAALWTKDGDYMEPDGRTVFGRAEVKRLLMYEHGSVFKDSEIHLAVEHVRLATDTAAVADGTYELFNVRDPHGNPISKRAGYFTSVLVKVDNVWKVSACRLMLPQTLIWKERGR